MGVCSFQREEGTGLLRLPTGVAPLEPGRLFWCQRSAAAARYGCTSRGRPVVRGARLQAREVATRYREVSAGERLANCPWASRNRIYRQQISDSKQTPRCALLHTGGWFFCKRVLLQKCLLSGKWQGHGEAGQGENVWLGSRVLSWPSWQKKGDAATNCSATLKRIKKKKKNIRINSDAGLERSPLATNI